MRSLLRFSHAGTNEALALPALNPDFLYAAQDTTAYAAFVKESRKKRAGAPKLHRKSGKRVIRVEMLLQSAKALLPPHKCGGCHQGIAPSRESDRGRRESQRASLEARRPSTGSFRHSVQNRVAACTYLGGVQAEL
jgi:hypothetical protein